MDWDTKSTLRISCARGLAPYLEEELRSLGFEPKQGVETGAEVEGSLRDALRLNLLLRTAFRVLYHVGSFRCDDGDQLYAGVQALPWETMISPDEYLSVASRVNHPTVTNSMWPNLKVKDAIVDRLRETTGKRPESGSSQENVVVTLHWSGREASIYVDTSGRKLSDRGYRKLPHSAPLRESLAAGILLACGYTGDAPLVNPMCGSGTLAIEAALIGSGRAPGLLRSNYAASHLLGFDSDAWLSLREDLNRASRGKTPAQIVASDRDPKALEAAKKNAQTAGVDQLIEFHRCEFEDTPVPEPVDGSIVILNPEYGARLGGELELEGTYGRIGDFFKQSCQGYTGWLFTGNRSLLKKIGLRATRRLPFFNGDIECRLARYLLYRGRHRANESDRA